MPDLAVAEMWSLTVKEVADRYSVDTETVYGWLRKRELTGLRLPNNGPWRITQDDIAEFEQRCRGQSSPSLNTGSSSAAASTKSVGPTPVVKIGAFQRGKQNATQR